MKPKLKPIHPDVRTGHVHLKVADLDRALAFYRDVLGFELTQRYGQQAAFLSAGGYHHHIGLNTWESPGGSPPHRNATGLYHLAIAYPIFGQYFSLRALITRQHRSAVFDSGSGRIWQRLSAIGRRFGAWPVVKRKATGGASEVFSRSSAARS